MGQLLSLESQSAAVFKLEGPEGLEGLEGLRARGIFTDPRGRRICERARNSFSWACSSAVHNCPGEAFEVEL